MGAVRPVMWDDDLFSNEYLAIDVKSAFSGGVLAGRGEVRRREEVDHEVFQYQAVTELIFENGRLLWATDRTAAIDECRATVREEIMPFSKWPDSFERTQSAVNSVLHRDYDFLPEIGSP